MSESEEDRFQIEINKMNIGDNEAISELIRDLTEPIGWAIQGKVNEILRNRIIPNLLRQFQEAIKTFAETLNNMDIQELAL